MPIEEFNLDRNIHWGNIPSEERKRQEAILEFILTEASYYRRLNIIYEVFYHECEKFITKVENDRIFQNIDELLLRSGSLLSELRSLQVKHNGAIPSISNLFLEHVQTDIHLCSNTQMKYFDCFRIYCMGHEEGSRGLQLIMGSNNRLAKFIQGAINDPRCCNLDLASFLLEPVQRLARYPLLLKQILHYTPREHPDHHNILQVVIKSEEYLASVNESVRAYESEARLKYFQNNLLVLLDGEVSHGLYLSDGCRMMSASKFWAIQEKISGEHCSLRHCCGNAKARESLDEISLREIDFDSTKLRLAHGIQRECSFEILKGSESIMVACETLADRQKWFKEFERGRVALIQPTRQFPILNLPCIGTVLITIVGGSNLVSADEPYCVLELNNQRVELRTSLGSSPVWNQSVVLSMASFDDHLTFYIFNYRKYAPNELVGSVDLSLDFLEYYDKRSTDRMDLFVGLGKCQLSGYPPRFFITKKMTNAKMTTTAPPIGRYTVYRFDNGSFVTSCGLALDEALATILAPTGMLTIQPQDLVFLLILPEWH